MDLALWEVGGGNLLRVSRSGAVRPGISIDLTNGNWHFLFLNYTEDRQMIQAVNCRSEYYHGALQNTPSPKCGEKQRASFSALV